MARVMAQWTFCRKTMSAISLGTPSSSLARVRMGVFRSQAGALRSRIGLCLLTFLGTFVSSFATEKDLSAFFTNNCIKCHGSEKQKGDVRLDIPSQELFAGREFLETVIGVLEDGEMPPKKAPPPKEEELQETVRFLKDRLLVKRESTLLKRLTRTEYTNTINDLFHAHFDLSEMLPPDHVEQGFDKFGEAHLMSPHQVMAYLKTARFVAERLLPDEKPEEQTWEFGPRNFHGSGRGDYRAEDAFILSTFYPWRSNIHFAKTEGKYDRFIIEEFGRYRFEIEANAIKSNENEVIGINLGDPRYPTNFHKIGRVPLKKGSKGFTVDLTLKAGDEVSFTFDSGRTWNVGQKPKTYKGTQLRFTKATITGPMIEQWPTVAMNKILPKPGMSPEALVDHLALLLTNRPLRAEEREGFVEIASKKQVSGASERAVARSVLIALLTSPHFIYKSESSELTDIELAYRLSYFLWNSVPDEALLSLAKNGALAKSLGTEVERMLKDPKGERFVEDYTRQWLQLDVVEELGPDMRVFKDVTTLQVAAMAQEGKAFFRHILDNDLSMKLFIDSDFIMVNDRLAKFYKIPEIDGDHFRPVKLREGSERGGLIAQAGFLKLTSEAFTTSPIRRGAWILKNLYNEKIDPPANVVIEEPDTRGTKTIKEALAKHMQSEACFRCHSKIDPLGFALEYYDPVGRYRKEYDNVEVVSKKEVKITKHPIETSMALSDGRRIYDMKSLKAVMLEDKERILKGIIAKLISYGIGRETTIADRPYIDEVYGKIQPQEYSLRAAIQEIILHPEFRRK